MSDWQLKSDVEGIQKEVSEIKKTVEDINGFKCNPVLFITWTSMLSMLVIRSTV